MFFGSVLGTLFRFELKMLLRDKRTIIVSIVLPILVMPLLLFSSSMTERSREERQEAKVFRYAVVGAEAALARQVIASYVPEAAAEDDAEDSDAVELKLEEVESTDPQAELEAQTLHFFVEALAPGVWLAEQAEEAKDEAPVAVTERPDKEEIPLPLLRLVYRANWDDSETASSEMRYRLRSARSDLRELALEESGFPVAAGDVAVIEPNDLATASQRTGATVGRFATLFVLLFLLTGGSVVAADAIAGEKERGTLETVLTTAASRRDIVGAKLLLILAVGIGITVIQILNLLLYVGLDLIPVPDSFAVDLSAGTVFMLLLLFLPLAAIAGSVLLLVSGYAKTYKEFQLYFFPVFILLLAPALASMLPAVELRSAIVLVPIANLSVAVRSILVGQFDLLFLAIAWLVSMAAAVFAGRATLRSLSTERLITASELDRADLEGGAALFPRHAWRWFLGMWVIMLLVATNLESMQGLRPQIFFNLIGLFLGGSLLMIWRYELPIREVLALRPVKPVVWLAVILGAPACHLAMITVAKISAMLFPVPERMLEGFSNLLMPAELPFWEVLLLVSVLPGICEEIAFRGVLLHALRQRFRPLALCLIVGVVFGMFHISLIRLLPTAVLGVVMAALTLVTGSIFPAMVWHALNNATAIASGYAGLPLTELEPWAYAAAWLVFGLVSFLLWRHRSVYPGLRRPAP